ncbi:MAG: UDP-N-acetylmuramate dehydrogenase [Desulfobacterales bacterium]|nr:UDP-N-acetylmuramate dehydrogenase [Desulfobacterales bacterium]
MDKRQKEELVKLAGGQVRFNCLMAEHTTFRTGGQVEAIYEANDLEGLHKIITFLNKEKVSHLTVGHGSNLLVKDGGLDGVVILLRGNFNAVEQKKSGPSGRDTSKKSIITAGAGLPIAELLTICRQEGLGGLEFLAGIPGTVGGAMAMNAGAFGEDIGSKVQEIEIITSHGRLITKDRAGIKFTYRNLVLEKGGIIVRVSFSVDRVSKESVAGKIADYLKKRKKRQPLEFPSAGSVFKNPPNDYAGRLIEEVGLKGKRIGGAVISEKHCNFIVNTGGAKAKDILDLLYLAQKKVKDELGVELEPEIQIAD